MPEGHLVSAPPLCQPCSAPQGQAESGGMVLVAYAGPVRPAAALRDSVLHTNHHVCVRACARIYSELAFKVHAKASMPASPPPAPHRPPPRNG